MVKYNSRVFTSYNLRKICY